MSIILLIPLVALGFVAVPNYRAARNRANTRACFANQKTISGAIEMYNKDKGTNRCDLSALLPELVSGGYLMAIPDDPGEGRGTTNHYFCINAGFGVGCNVHGTVRRVN
jgi:competence protein ComGC